jgi:2-C-methyl-D-erythritol 4-phosphate cytidylyltransferase
LGAGAPKAFVVLGSRTLLRHALDQSLSCDDVDHVVGAVPAADLQRARDLLLDHEVSRVDVVPGGADRTASVRAGLGALRPDDDIVLVHDAARALAPPSLFTSVIGAIRRGHGAVVPGVAVVDTIKRVDTVGRVLDTPDRAGLRAIQTPQGFARDVLVAAHRENASGAASVTDDAGLVEAMGGEVYVIEGHPRAHKVTTPLDLRIAEFYLEEMVT